ncbi:MAG: hypothetical protein ABIL05_01775, partial [candidate division WOR-3 bacterium]
YIKRLQEEYGRPDEYDYFLTIIENIIGSDQHLNLFKNRSPRGKIILYFGRRLIGLHEEFLTLLLSYLQDEKANSIRWQKFFESYRNELVNCYSAFIKDEKPRLILFEIGNRKVIRDILTKKIRAGEPLNSDILVKVSRTVNSLFYYARKVMSSSIRFDDTLIAESYDKVLTVLPRIEEPDLMRLLTAPIQGQKMPVAFFDLLASYIKGQTLATSEKELLESIAKRSFFTRDDLKKMIMAYPLGISDGIIEKILIALRDRLNFQLGQLTNEKDDVMQRLNEFRGKMREYVNTFAQKVCESAQNFSTQEILRSTVNEMTTPLVRMGYYIRELDGKHRELVKKEECIKMLLQVEKADILSWIKDVPYRHLLELVLANERGIPPIDETGLQKELRDLYRAAKSNPIEMELMNTYRRGGIFTERFEIPRLIDQFQVVIREVIKPVVITLLFEELVEYFPPLGQISHENLKFLAEEIAENKVYTLAEEIEKPGSPNVIISDETRREIEQFRSVVSVLVYDIRGSTFMGTKLQNARKESEIRNLFNKAMLETVIKYGGMPIKDTGDGGIIFFCANARELTLADKRENLNPESGESVGITAARCGIEMVQKAQEFVEENLMKYGEWFKDVEEREIKFEGITLATLPPEYKKIFQVGIGIASGFYPREVYLDRNAFNEIDISGMLVREANIFSKAKRLEGSIVLCDDTTVYNLILNAPKFSFVSDKGLKIDPIVNDVIQALDYWLKVREERRGFMIEMFKLLAQRVDGKVVYDKECKMFATLDDFSLSVRDEGFHLDAKGGRTKYLFELTRG